ncbi:MAG: Unknown protein [uncultured Sulfurovum sp.]|uniref:DUF1835 domain-containing protein n=1 Tax=uncultured Sulfurovum sp. TaxID=269237 RepID=A0A6S6SU70_9BACT|nr:MAG: Unknown protein [uncultured Sulfurovum sp.]
MSKILNIVNGDACINIMKVAEIKGDFLPWKDFLHAGPVPTHASLEELSKIRAKFIASCGFGSLQEVNLDFLQRNQKLLNYENYEKIILWFEHDLYDQLQLIQILAWFSKRNLTKINLTLICTNNYLGESTSQQIKKLLHYETTINKKHLDLAQETWLAFGQKTPKRFAKILDKPTAILPFLQATIYRMLEEYPSTKYGLSRTEHQALLIIASGIDNKVDIFVKNQIFEEKKFMGDIIFWKILDNFEKYKVVKNNDGRLSITFLGEQLLEGTENWVGIKTPSHYLGGVKLDSENLWCWDIDKKEIKQYYYSKPLKSLLKVKQLL